MRYQPDAQQYLELSDFAFFRLAPKRARYIGGFAQMGWLEQNAWGQAQTLSLNEEAALLRDLANDLPASLNLLGLDCYGVDLVRHGLRSRHRFQAPIESSDIRANIKRIVEMV